MIVQTVDNCIHIRTVNMYMYRAADNNRVKQKCMLHICISACENDQKEEPKQPQQSPPTKDSLEPKSVTWQPWPVLTDYSPYPGAWMGLTGPAHNPFLFGQQSMFLPREGRQSERNVPLNLVQREYTYGDNVFDLGKYLPKEKEWAGIQPQDIDIFLLFLRVLYKKCIHMMFNQQRIEMNKI